MENCIQRFIANKMFGGIGAVSKNNKTNTKGNSSNTNVRFQSSDYHSDKYLNELENKRTRVYGKWNQFKQKFGFGESLTAEESSILHKQDMKKALAKAHEKLGSDFNPERESRGYDW